VFSGAREDYLVTAMKDAGGAPTGQYVVEHLNGDDGMNLIEGVENLQFGDETYDVASIEGSNPGEAPTLTYDITIDAGLVDGDQSEDLSSITIEGVPAGASFNQGTPSADGTTWTMTQEDLQGLSLTVTEAVTTDIPLTVSVTSTEQANGDTATSTSTIDVGLPDGWGVAADSTATTADPAADVLDPLSVMFTDDSTLEIDGESYDISSLTDDDAAAKDAEPVAPMGSRSESDGDGGSSGSDPIETGDSYSIDSNGCDDGSGNSDT